MTDGPSELVGADDLADEKEARSLDHARRSSVALKAAVPAIATARRCHRSRHDPDSHQHNVFSATEVNDPGSENDLAPCYTAPGSISGNRQFAGARRSSRTTAAPTHRRPR